jgi:hypothetical protein
MQVINEAFILFKLGLRKMADDLLRKPGKD